MLLETEYELWQSINEFPLDITAAKLKFSDRLAKENNWTVAYTNNVITEYRKFLFLCCVTPKGTMITPSDAVDQAWHLHLTYTKSYWKDLCENTLKREIHHTPTQGGIEEGKKFENCYEHTFDLYREKFGTEPPKNIWLDNEQRFAPDNFVRINTKNYLLLQKPLWFTKFTNSISFTNSKNFTKPTSLSIFLIIILGLGFIQAFDISLALIIIQGILFLVALVHWIRSNRQIKKLRLQEEAKKIALSKKTTNNANNIKANLQKTSNKEMQKKESQDSEIIESSGDLGFIVIDGIMNGEDYRNSDFDSSNSNDYNSNDASSNDFSSYDSSSSSDSSSGDSGSSGCSSSCGGGCGGGD
jgi:hypothetical protein